MVDLERPFGKLLFFSHIREICFSNNLNILVVMECFGNREENARIAKQIGMSKEFKIAQKIYKKPFGYILFNLSPRIMSNHFRCCVNYFSENQPFFPIFYAQD